MKSLRTGMSEVAVLGSCCVDPGWSRRRSRGREPRSRGGARRP
uniref:Uncharacterized protein n=1 Tax=Arundo donax TaxID=35708 RepID=A0A0A8YEJ5_ARUDO